MDRGTACSRLALAAIFVLVLLPCSRGGDVLTRLLPLGDASIAGTPGPNGRNGHTAVVTDDSRVLVFGGRSDFANGDFLNDMWLYDWATGNWTAYVANEVVCEQCDVCERCAAPSPASRAVAPIIESPSSTRCFVPLVRRAQLSCQRPGRGHLYQGGQRHFHRLRQLLRRVHGKRTSRA